jgi:hypothetical protein
MAHDALGESATKILDRGRLRRLGQLDIRGLVDVYIDGEALEDKRLCEAPPLGAMERKRLEKLIESDKADEQQSDGDLEDGFITL